MAHSPRTDAAPGDASPPPSDFNGPTADETVDALSRYATLRREQQQAAQRVKDVVAAYEFKGGHGEDLKDLHKLMQRDKREAVATIERRYRLAIQVGIVEVDWETDGQAHFLKAFGDVKPAGGDAAQRLAEARAYNDGYNSAKHGAPLEGSPFDGAPGSSQFVAWRDGWTDGYAERKDQAGEPATAPRPRGRPRKVREAMATTAQSDSVDIGDDARQAPV